mgnify:CR=1 FL=1
MTTEIFKNVKISILNFILILLFGGFSVGCSRASDAPSIKDENVKFETNNLAASLNIQSPVLGETNILKSINSIFEEWEKNLIKKEIFDYVTKEDCDNFEKMMELYGDGNGKYPMSSNWKNIVIDFSDTYYDESFHEVNNEIKYHAINYGLSNCVRGNGGAGDFILLKSEKGILKIDEIQTNKLKKKFLEYVMRNFGEDNYVRVENNFIETDVFKINSIYGRTVNGWFGLQRDACSHCTAIKGEFTYQIDSNKFDVSNVKRINLDDQ